MKKISVVKTKGFTLIELIIVIVVLAIMAGIAIPNISGYIERTKTTNAIADANQLAAALNIYNATLPTPMSAVPTAAYTQTNLGPAPEGLNIMPKLKGALADVLDNVGFDNVTTQLFYARDPSDPEFSTVSY